MYKKKRVTFGFVNFFRVVFFCLSLIFNGNVVYEEDLWGSAKVSKAKKLSLTAAIEVYLPFFVKNLPFPFPLDKA